MQDVDTLSLRCRDLEVVDVSDSPALSDRALALLQSRTRLRAIGLSRCPLITLHAIQSVKYAILHNVLNIRQLVQAGNLKVLIAHGDFRIGLLRVRRSTIFDVNDQINAGVV